MRFQFPLYKMFLITAAYAVAFSAFSRLGAVGAIIATFVGTLLSLVILAVRSKKDILAGGIAAIGSSVGIFFASLLAPVGLRLRPYGPVDGLQDWAILSAGAILGAILFSWASKR